MKRTTSLVLAVLMLVSIMASMNPIEMNEKEPVDDANGRADYEVWLIGANSPRESTTGIGGDVRNAVDVGEDIFFDLVIRNIGDNDISEMNVMVTVTTSMPNTPPIIDATDSAVCDDSSICDHAVLPSGDYFEQGRYQVRDASGSPLTWAPAFPGTYTVTIDVDSGDQDTDLTNNQLQFTVIAADWYDVSVELEWDETGTDDPISGPEAHGFTLTAMVNGSNEWQARSVELEITFAGAFKGWDDATGGAISMFDSDDGNGMSGCPGGQGSSQPCVFTATFGEEVGAGHLDPANNSSGHQHQHPADIEVYANMSMDPPLVQNASDIGETRLVPIFQQPYTFHGSIKADTATSSGVGGYTVLASLKSYDTYEMVQTDYSQGGPGGNGSTQGEVVNEMKEVSNNLDDRNGNNDAELTGTFASYHDVRVIDVEAGIFRQQSGRIDAGMTTVYATVEHSGSDKTINYDWVVEFSIKDSDGLEVMGSPMMATQCDQAGMSEEEIYSHLLLGEMVPAFLEGKACTVMLIDPGMHTVTATITMIDASLTDTNGPNGTNNPADDCGTGSNPACKTDMNSANNGRTSHYEVVNVGPAAYLTVEMDSEAGPVIDGSLVQFSTRVEHMNQPDIDFDGNPQPFQYTWSMVGNGEMIDEGAMMNCMGMPTCDVYVNMMWLGNPVVTVTIGDWWGVETTASASFTMWNNFSNTDTGDCWDVQYDIYFNQMLQFFTNFSDADDVTGVNLEGSTGSWDSICTFNVDVTHQMYPADVDSESLSVTLDADPAVGHSLWYEGATQWVELTGTTQTQVDADTIQLSWTNDGSLPSRSSATYGVFASATLGQPPQAGIDSLTATLSSAGVIDLNWQVNNSQLVNSETDFGVIYINDDGAALDGDRYIFALDQTSWPILGEHGKTYEFLVRVENGELDGDGNSLFGTPVDSGSATADAQVDPVAGATGLDAEKSGADSITFVWSAADASDVDHWLICWSPTAHTSLEVTSLIGAGNCHPTADSSTTA
ncbi:MAG: hypothetical protein QF831_04760, partial [Candidatus Thalassarchaeaceae archaeon]|nr:hypothetical protein [Candidatus Thalassarchaeaceae archaeon]